MKKKFLIGSMLPALVGAAIVGSGFSLWFFNNTATTESQNNVNKNVTQLVEIGTITVADDFTVVFDQKTRTTNLANAGLAAEGIFVDFGSSTNKVAQYNKATEGEDIIAGSTKVVFTTKIELTNGLDEYVKVAYDSENFTYSATAHSFTYSLTFESNTATEAMVFDWEKVAFSYAENKEPKNKEAYKSFKDLVNHTNTKINVTYTAELVGTKA